MKKCYLILSIFFYAQVSIAQWLPINGPFGENTSLPVFFDSVYYCASYQGMITSFDDGQTWSEANVSFYNRYMSIVYFNEGKLIYDKIYDLSGWISLDSGATWTQMTAPTTFAPIRYLVSNGVIYTITVDGFTYKSYDNGVSWTPYYQPPSSNNMNDFTEDNGRLYWVVSGNGSGPSEIFYSDDEGMSWYNYNVSGIPNPGTFYQIIANGNQAFVSCNTGLYKTIDGGATWTLFDAGLPANYAYFYHYTRIYAAAEKIYAYVHNGASLYSSDTTTASFTNISTGLPFEVYVSGIAENNNKLYFSSPSGLFATDKTNINWQPACANIHLRSYASMNALDSTLIVGGNYSATVSHDFGTTFSTIPSGEYTSEIYIKNDTIYAASARGYRSTDHGYTWTSLNFPYGFFGQNLKDFCKIGNYWFGLNMGDQAVKYSSNNGGTWTNLTGLPANAVTCIESSNTGLFAGTNSGIYKSLNNGTTWTTSLTGNNISTVLFENGNLFALTNTKLYVSFNNGTSWQDMNYSGSYPQTFTVKNNTVVVTPGLYYTSDFGVNWSSLAGPVHLVPQNPTQLKLTDTWLYAACYDTIYKLSATLLTAIAENQITDKEIYISPNPVNDMLQVTVPEDSRFTSEKVKIYDIAGRIQKTGPDNFSDERHSEFHLDNLPEGIYFIEIEVDNYPEILKVVKLISP